MELESDNKVIDEDIDSISTSSGYIGGLRYTKLLKDSKNRWKTLLNEVKKYDTSNPVVKSILKTISMGFYIPLYYYHKLKKDELKYTYKIVNSWGKSLVKIAKIKLEIIGSVEIREERSYVFIANHTSPYDIPIIYATLPVLAGFVANQELSKMPVMNFWMRKAYSIFVDIYDLSSKISTIKKIYNNLINKRHVIIFPEGKMSPDGNLQKFNKGGLKAAELAESIIIPIALIGVREVIPPGGFLLNIEKDIKVCFGTPIDVKKLSTEEKKDIDQYCYSKLKELIDSNN